MPIRHIRKYTIDCTGDVCQGDDILFSETVFGGSHRSPVALGTRRIAAAVDDKHTRGSRARAARASLSDIGIPFCN